jgi:hypothetical protein
MDGNRDQPFDPPLPPRRFVYRSATPDTNHAHPLRRATDTPHPFHGTPEQLCPKTQLLRFRVYLKVN